MSNNDYDVATEYLLNSDQREEATGLLDQPLPASEEEEDMEMLQEEDEMPESSSSSSYFNS